MLSTILALTLAVGPTLPVEDAAARPVPPAPIESTGSPVCDHVRALDIPYLSTNPEGFAEHCPDIVPPFMERGGYRDAVHALFVVACESGFSPISNDIRWGWLRGGKPEGLYAFMTHLDWATRIFGREYGDAFDPRDTVQASYLASVMVYDKVNPKVRPPNFYWWWSCARSYGRPFEAIFGRGTAPESRYCPPPDYWQNVPPTSNFNCGGKTYGR